MLGALSRIIEQNQTQLPLSTPPSHCSRIDWGAASRPVIKAIQAAVTLGTGSSLGPEGPSVDIGKAWGEGMAELLKNTRERKVALLAAGAAAGIASGIGGPEYEEGGIGKGGGMRIEMGMGGMGR